VSALVSSGLEVLGEVPHEVGDAHELVEPLAGRAAGRRECGAGESEARVELQPDCAVLLEVLVSE
jgi:hypothetical protein